MWNKFLRFKIWKAGGRIKYLFKITAKSPRLRTAVNTRNLWMARTCRCSVRNQGWCDLPCYECKLFDPNDKLSRAKSHI